MVMRVAKLGAGEVVQRDGELAPLEVQPGELIAHAFGGDWNPRHL
jgi:hypothetical protein